LGGERSFAAIFCARTESRSAGKSENPKAASAAFERAPEPDEPPAATDAAESECVGEERGSRDGARSGNSLIGGGAPGDTPE
jgi:hypothetical protein